MGLGDAAALGGEIDDLGDGEQAHRGRHQSDAGAAGFAPAPKVHGAESVKRSVAVCMSRPTSEKMKPRPPAASPLITLPPLSAPTKVTPATVSMKNSGVPRASTSGVTTGMATAMAPAPMSAPMSELMSEAPSARPASPFLAMGWPSTMVEAVEPSPGMPNRMEVMSPVVAVTAIMPSRKENASTASILSWNANPSMSAMVTGPPRPGSMPTAKPMSVAQQQVAERRPGEDPDESLPATPRRSFRPCPGPGRSRAQGLRQKDEPAQAAFEVHDKGIRRYPPLGMVAPCRQRKPLRGG